MRRIKFREEPPLPPGYVVEHARRCIFAIENDNSTPGYKGLAWAILLMAVHDGCCARWLREIANGYALPVPETMFERAPANRIKQKKGDHDLMAVEMPREPGRLVLGWSDGMVPANIGNGQDRPSLTA